ncbi:hypothetical protein [Caminicella sporogenes]|uniref:hypothetical protein n=1 Tax=Caminicella sporogenes TaxID=166485 RepID=UPI001FA8DD39|nr:hypothetical protein [Caminicella sporogenes]
MKGILKEPEAVEDLLQLKMQFPSYKIFYCRLQTNKRGEVMDKTDCFAYNQRSCKILTEKKCDGCVFYKTHEEFKLGQKKALERILSLDKDKRDYIIETYYGGKIEVM